MTELDLSPLDLLEIPDLEKYVTEVIMLDDEGEPIKISDEDKEQIIEGLMTEKANIEAQLANMGGTLESKFQEFSRRRTLKEREWVNALLQHDGRSYNYKGSKKQQIFGTDSIQDKPVVNITRQKVNLAVARMRDIQFPLGGDYNFRILPHPDIDVELAEGSQDPNVQQTVQQVKQNEYERSRRMQYLIQQQLVRAKYGNKARDAMRDWVLLGTAVLKGPCIDMDRIKSYTMESTSNGRREAVLDYKVEQFPNVYRVDPKYFYPDPDALKPDELFEAVEIHPMTRTQLIELQHNSAFIKSQLREAINEEPEGISSINLLSELSILETDANLDNRYIVKEYHGPLPKEYLARLGLIDQDDADDPFEEFYGDVWFINGRVIRISLNPIEGMFQIPYYVVPWEWDDASLFGHGMAWMMRDAQRVAKSGWEMLLDNAGLSSGPQMVVHREMIEPADGRWEIEPHKIWYFTEYGGNVNEAFQFFNVPNNQQQIANVVEMAMQFGDLESESPMIQQNLIPQANNTASGQAMMLTIGNVTLRDKSQLWDDYGTRPLITNQYHYNMQYHDDERVKGNFEIELAGATETVDAQLRAQEVERILSLAATNPEYSLHIKPGEAFREIVAATRIGPRLLRSDEEVQMEIQRIQQEQANQPPDPETIRAQTAQMREQIRQQEVQMDSQYKQAELQLEQMKAQMALEQAQIESQAELLTTQLRTEMEMLKMAVDVEDKAAQREHSANIEALRESVKIAVEQSRQEAKREEMELKRATGSGI